MAVTYTLIGQSTLASQTSSFTFSNIPATYQDLSLRVCARCTYNSTPDGLFQISLNNTTSGYSDTILYATGSSSGSYRNASSSYMEIYGVTAVTASTNYFGNMELYIPNYASSSEKVAFAFGAPETRTGAFNFGLAMSAHNNALTAAINQIVVDVTFDYVANSSFYLYGIKKS